MSHVTFQRKLEQLATAKEKQYEFHKQGKKLETFDFGTNDPEKAFDFDVFIDVCEAYREMYRREFPDQQNITLEACREKLDEDAFTDTWEEQRQKVRSRQEHYEQRPEELEDELRAIAEDLEVQGDPDKETVLDTSSVSTYHTQGLGKEKYAKNALKTTLTKATYYGIEAKIRDVSDDDNHRLADYAVVAKISEHQAKILEYKPEPPFRDVLKSLLQDGANPRVYFPWLADLDRILDEMNLDRFGNEVA